MLRPGLPRRPRSTHARSRRRCPKPGEHQAAGDAERRPHRTSRTTSPTSSCQRRGTSGVYGGDLRVRTTIDLGLQKLAREAIAKELPPSIGPTAALVATRRAHRRGARDDRRPQLPPQPVQPRNAGRAPAGSAFKPFVLAAALEAGISPATTLVSKPRRDLPRRQALERQQLRGRIPRPDRPRTRRSPSPTTRSSRS